VNDVFGLAILGRGIGARETQLNVVGEEGARGVVVKLVTIITLEGTDLGDGTRWRPRQRSG
jgi:hypothetical protein